MLTAIQENKGQSGFSYQTPPNSKACFRLSVVGDERDEKHYRTKTAPRHPNSNRRILYARLSSRSYTITEKEFLGFGGSAHSVSDSLLSSLTLAFSAQHGVFYLSVPKIDCGVLALALHNFVRVFIWDYKWWGLIQKGLKTEKKRFEMSYSTAVLIEVKTVFSFTIKAFKTSFFGILACVQPPAVRAAVFLIFPGRRDPHDTACSESTHLFCVCVSVPFCKR